MLSAFEPGQKLGYANIGNRLLGKIGERVSGLQYSDDVCTHILLPITLNWHVGEAQRHGERYLFNEGGGPGFHREMPIYRAKNRASLVRVNRALGSTQGGS